MNTPQFANLEAAVRTRNPALAERLQPGLPGTSISRKLERIGVRGAVQPITELFSWKNGVDNECLALSLQQASLFPKSVLQFNELDMMAADFQGFNEGLEHHPEYSKVAGRYFPMFSDCASSWLAVDLDPRHGQRIVFIQPEFEHMVFQAYGSFVEFLDDAIRANNDNDALSCFDHLRPIT